MTIIKRVSSQDYSYLNETIAQAAEIIRNGGLVAFPTETVYGLGADALNPLAVKKIYEAKGRPSDNPLIVHISDLSELKELVSEINDNAEILINKFWPGPLTLIFKKNQIVPFETSGGLDTVAVRLPKNEIARLLIKESKRFIAAPSANSSGKPSPTRASHVEFDLSGKIDMIIDGGSCEFGLESTIVDVSSEIPVLLRPGSITPEMLKSVLENIEIENEIENFGIDTAVPKAPGMKYKHYSPNAKVTIVCGDSDKMITKIKSMANEYYKNNKIGILATEQTKDFYDSEKYLVLVLGDRDNENTIAANLFKMLRKFDFYGVDYVLAEGFAETELGYAIMNRLKKASAYNIINL